MDDGLHARIESIRIRGFRSLADVKVTDLPPVAVLIGANGSGKSNVMRPDQADAGRLAAHQQRARGSGDRRRGRAPASPQQKTASVVVNLLRNCVTYQFHDTSDESRFKQSWDMTDNGFLRSHGGNLAAVLHRLEAEENDWFG